MKLQRLTTPMQRGQAGIEMVLFGSALLGLGVFSYELMQVYGFRMVALHALQESVRAGATAQAHPQVLAETFAKHMTRWPRHHRLQTSSSTSLYQLHVHSPNAQDFQRLADPQLSARIGVSQPAINHLHQYRQSLQFGQSDIFQANVLDLSLDYAYKPHFAFSQLLLRTVAVMVPQSDLKHALQQGQLRLRLRAQYPMHSHALEWPTNAWPSEIRYATTTAGYEHALAQRQAQIGIQDVALYRLSKKEAAAASSKDGIGSDSILNPRLPSQPSASDTSSTQSFPPAGFPSTTVPPPFGGGDAMSSPVLGQYEDLILAPPADGDGPMCIVPSA